MNPTIHNLVSQAFQASVMDVNGTIEKSVRNPVLIRVLTSTGRSCSHALDARTAGRSLALHMRDVKEAVVGQIRSPIR